MTIATFRLSPHWAKMRRPGRILRSHELRWLNMLPPFGPNLVGQPTEFLASADHAVEPGELQIIGCAR